MLFIRNKKGQEEAMKTLVGLEQQPPLQITSPSPWRPRSSILLPTSITERPYLHTARRAKQRVKAKGGFNGTPADARGTPKQETLTRKEYGKSDGGGEDDDDKIPAAVMERMIVRTLICVGAPLVAGVVLLQTLKSVKEHQVWDVPIWLPFLTTFFTFGASTLGVAYGTLSTSWDPHKKGSVLGFEEAQTNWVAMWEEDDEK